MLARTHLAVDFSDNRGVHAGRHVAARGVAARASLLLLLDTATMAEPIMVTFGDIGMVGGMPTASVPGRLTPRWLLRLGLYIVEVAAALAARSNDATDEA